MIFLALFDDFLGSPALSGQSDLVEFWGIAAASGHNGICSVNCIAKVAATAASATKRVCLQDMTDRQRVRERETDIEVDGQTGTS